MTDPRETDAYAYYRADSGRDKNDTRRADETLRRGEIAPFRMEVRADTHFTYLFVPGRGIEPRVMHGRLHCNLGKTLASRNEGRP
jgi:hypothetical protein